MQHKADISTNRMADSHCQAAFSMSLWWQASAAMMDVDEGIPWSFNMGPDNQTPLMIVF